jgi:hypothetical protein
MSKKLPPSEYARIFRDRKNGSTRAVNIEDWQLVKSFIHSDRELRAALRQRIEDGKILLSIRHCADWKEAVLYIRAEVGFLGEAKLLANFPEDTTRKHFRFIHSQRIRRKFRQTRPPKPILHNGATGVEVVKMAGAGWSLADEVENGPQGFTREQALAVGRAMSGEAAKSGKNALRKKDAFPPSFFQKLPRKTKKAAFEVARRILSTDMWKSFDTDERTRAIVDTKTGKTVETVPGRHKLNPEQGYLLKGAMAIIFEKIPVRRRKGCLADFDSFYGEVWQAIPRVKFVHRQPILKDALALAKEAIERGEISEEADCITSDNARLLFVFMEYLQELAIRNDGPQATFFLSERMAGKAIGVSPATARRYFQSFQARRLIFVAKPGSASYEEDGKVFGGKATWWKLPHVVVRMRAQVS